MATVLIVDDEEIVLKLCSSMLRLGGHNVLLATGAESALRLLDDKAATVDLAVLDIMMPGVNGIELAARIQLVHPRIGVILMTGYSMREIQGLTGEKNPYRIIWKPFKTESFLRMIDNALEALRG
jgi:DNA-binding NtrC family response regulator